MVVSTAYNISLTVIVKVVEEVAGLVQLSSLLNGPLSCVQVFIFWSGRVIILCVSRPVSWEGLVAKHVTSEEELFVYVIVVAVIAL